MTNEDINSSDFIEESNGISKSFLNKRYQIKDRRHKFYPKCSKCLKKKYKKYKINNNQCEDPEVLKVSHIFDKSLDFKGLFKLDYLDSDELSRPRNYLSKMAKHKKKSVSSPKSKPSSENNQKRKTDAFQLLMNSRNKSIGTNSPGKADIKLENSEEIMIKKANKAKRNLSLQKMAEAKGALKRIEEDEFQEKCIKQKMDKRAKRLKQMISKCNKKDLEKGQDNTVFAKNETSSSKGKKELKKSKPNSEINGILCSNKEPDIKVVAKPIEKQRNILREDNEFLSKLSPSIRKKENMLCYFKKLDNTTEKVSSDLDDLEPDIIKVKVIKKKKKKSKLSLTKCKDEVLNEDKDLVILPINGDENVVIIDHPVIPSLELNGELDKPRKRKRKLKEIDVNQEDNLDRSQSTERRSMRTKKKPVRYDDNLTFSSDEDLPIFHLKRPKHGKDDLKSNNKESDKIAKQQNSLSKIIKPPKQKPNAKLAPIFVSKTPLDAEALEAKQKFLQSGVPEQLKKIIAQKIITETITANFQKVIHVKQYTDDFKTIIKCKVNLMIEREGDDLKSLTNYPCREFLSMDDLQNYTKASVDQIAKTTKQILQGIKESYPDFPVFRTYKTLKNKSKDDHTNNFLNLDNSLEVTLDEADIQDSKMLCWTDKYRAASTQEIFGNFENIKDLRKWLVTWKESNLFTRHSQKTKDSDESDFCHSDSDSKDSIANSNNLLIVTGPTGCGKTSSIYAVANELSIKVIEVNASSRRTGKILLQELQEATLSHKVNRGKGSSAENSQNFGETNSQTPINQKKKHNKNIISHSKKLLSQTSETSCHNSQENGHTDVSLILIDDADIVFDQDDGFVSGIAQLIHVSKRPVILVTSSLSCQSLQRFSQCNNIIKLHPLSPRILGTWLDILCIADCGLCWPGMGAKILSQNKGDIRKSINYLQFVACSEKLLKNNGVTDTENKDSQNEDLATDSPDENSNMSWSRKKHLESKHVEINQELDITAYEPSKWNIYDDWRKSGRNVDGSNISELGNLFDSFSMIDYINKNKSNDCLNPFYISEINSVSEKETFEEYNGCNDLASEISRYLIDKSKANMDACSSIQSLNADDQREREKIVTRHNVLSSSLVSATVMDRRAIALDYWSLCRSICRIEKQKTDSNSKRNNRFYHYLKTSKVMCKTDVFNKLCRSLQEKQDYHDTPAGPPPLLQFVGILRNPSISKQVILRDDVKPHFLGLPTSDARQRHVTWPSFLI